MNRKQIVVNGCSGACCEHFSLPLSIEEMKRNNEAVEKEKIFFIKDNGIEQSTFSIEETSKILDMVIFLEKTEHDYQYGDNITKSIKKKYILDRNLEWKGTFKESLNFEDFDFLSKNYRIKSDKIYNLVYTCKHFDKENRVCLNYDNRPQMCRNFGNSCAYKACTFKQKRDNEINEFIENFNNENICSTEKK